MRKFETFKKALEKERKSLISELKGVSVLKNAKNPDDWQARSPETRADRADSSEVAEKIESYEENLALVSNLEERLKNIDGALEAIKNGSYGFCEVCKLPIEEDRLNANPAARTCKKHIETHIKK